MDIENIKKFIKQGKYQYSNHAKEMMFARYISESQVIESILKGEVLETYTQDVRGKSYLILGDGPVHVVAGYNKYTAKAIIITTYVPEDPEWITSRKRGK